MQELLGYKTAMKFKQVTRIAEIYKMTQTLGAGAFGSVKLGLHRKTKMPCAIKIIRKANLMKHEVYQQLNTQELEVLELTQHPNITRIFELLEDSKHYYIVMEVITGGNLLDKITRMQMFTERQAAGVIKQLLLALNYMDTQH